MFEPALPFKSEKNGLEVLIIEVVAVKDQGINQRLIA